MLPDDPFPKPDSPKLKIVDDKGLTPIDEPIETIKLEPSKKVAPLKKSKKPKFEPFSLEPEPPAAGGEPIENQSGAQNLSIPPGYVFLIVLVFLAFFASGIAMLIIDRPAQLETLQGQVRVSLNSATQERATGKALLKRFEDNLHNYLSASSVEEKAQYVRHPKRVLPLMLDYYEKHPLVTHQNAELISQTPISIETYPFTVLNAQISEKEQVTLLAEFTDEERLRFDWESEVAYQPLSPDELLKEKPTDSLVVRAFAKPDRHYVHEFKDKDKYQSYQLIFRDSDVYLFGYAEIGGQVHRKLEEHFAKTLYQYRRKPEPVLVSISFPKNPKSQNCVSIDKFIAPRWAYLENPEHE